MSTVVGLVMWVLLIWGARRLARWGKAHGASPSTVSGNQTGKKWEQIAPFPECFDEVEDDL